MSCEKKTKQKGDSKDSQSRGSFLCSLLQQFLKLYKRMNEGPGSKIKAPTKIFFFFLRIKLSGLVTGIALPDLHFLDPSSHKMNCHSARTSWVLLVQKFQITVLSLGSVEPGRLYVARSCTIWPLITSMLVWGMSMSGHTPAGNKPEKRRYWY